MTAPTARPSPPPPDTIDDHLGPAEHRFFGEGFKRAELALGSLTLEATGQTAHIRGRARVDYPDNWSRKADVNQRPHLSTVDVLLFGCRLAELHLANSLGLDEAERSRSWLRRVVIKAGNAPVEAALNGFDVNARLVGTGASPDGGDRNVSVLECGVDALTIRLEVDHPNGRPVGLPEGAGPTSLAEGRLAGSPYGTAYRNHRQDIRGVQVVGTTAEADVRVIATGAASRPGPGIEGRWQPRASMVDAFVTSLQLGQVLLYKLDSLTRAASATLWMRRTTLEATASPLPSLGTERVRVALEDSAVLTRGETRWRRSDIVGDLHGVSLRCSVAHQLPNSEDQR